MKTRKLIATAILFAASISSLAVVGVSAEQIRPERASVAIVVDAGIIGQLNGLESATAQLDDNQREAVLRRSNMASLAALEQTIADENADFAKDQIARHAELELRDRIAAVLVALGAFSAAACAMGAILLMQAYREPKSFAQSQIKSTSSQRTATQPGLTTR